MKQYAFYRNHLPHINFPEAVQFITFRLSDALPQHIEIKSARLEQEALDRSYGSCVLNIPEVAEILELILKSLDGKHYDLISYVIMPNHVHVLIELLINIPVFEIVRHWKGNSAQQINTLLRKRGRLWQKGYFDRYIRDYEHFKKVINYIDMNPVKAGLCRVPQDWRWRGDFSRPKAAN